MESRNEEPEVQSVDALPPENAAEEGIAASRGGEAISRGGSVEVHPPHVAAHSAKEFLIQLGTITAGVLIALSIEGLMEWNHHRSLVQEAHEMIAREIADNKSALARHFTEWDRSVEGIERSLTLADELLAARKPDIHQIQLGYHLASLSDASWRTAERTGALTYMEYSAVQDYAKLYGHQQLYSSKQQRIMDRTISALSMVRGDDPYKAPTGDIERFRLELMALRGELLADKQLGESLAKAYDEALAKHKSAE